MKVIYKVIYAEHLSSLERDVTNYLQDGFQLVGGIAVEKTDEYCVYLQAVIKFDGHFKESE